MADLSADLAEIRQRLQNVMTWNETGVRAGPLLELADFRFLLGALEHFEAAPVETASFAKSVGHWTIGEPDHG